MQYNDDHLKRKDASEAEKLASEKKEAYDQAHQYFRDRKQNEVQTGKLGVDLSVQTCNLRNQSPSSWL